MKKSVERNRLCYSLKANLSCTRLKKSFYTRSLHAQLLIQHSVYSIQKYREKYFYGHKYRIVKSTINYSSGAGAGSTISQVRTHTEGRFAKQTLLTWVPWGHLVNALADLVLKASD